MNKELRNKILSSRPTKLTPVTIEEWGDVTIFIREMTVSQRDEFESGQVKRNEDGTSSLELRGLKARLVVLTACDEEGNPIFSEEDIPDLMETGAAGLERAFTVAQRVNRMRKEDTAGN